MIGGFMRNRGKDKELMDKITQLERSIMALSIRYEKLEEDMLLREQEAMEIVSSIETFNETMQKELPIFIEKEVAKVVNTKIEKQVKSAIDEIFGDDDQDVETNMVETCQHGVYRDPLKCGKKQGFDAPCSCECHLYHKASDEEL